MLTERHSANWLNAMKRAILLALALSFIAHAGQSKRKTHPSIEQANRPPVISRFEASATLVHTCGPNICVPKERRAIILRVSATDTENDPLTYEYSPTGGEILGTGNSVSWRLGGERVGDYVVTVKVTDSKGASTAETLKVAVKECWSCRMSGPEPPCPLISVTAWSDFTETKETYRGGLLYFHAMVQTDSYFQTRPDYVWTVSNGRLLSGQHTPSIKVETMGEPGKSVTATIEIEGFDPSCIKKADSSLVIKD
jgi:hypothetical protein